MRAEQSIAIEYMVAELASALLALKEFGTFNNPSAMPKDANEMPRPISNYAQSFFDTKLRRLVEVSPTVYGVSIEGAFLQEIADAYQRWSFPIRKRRFLEKLGLEKWAPNFVQSPSVPKVMTEYAPWNDPSAFGNTVRFQHDMKHTGVLSVFMTEGLAAWRTEPSAKANRATSVYLVISKEKKT